ncbi:hypothetical protein Tsubulata_027480 [Turnera subulata]|uniref:Uncharacterized protein n=1 Tax=Turnera subulata TaxID=218843 RepID=A0A9Q0F3Y0_9ROSI|nr:hypothetical protein Tsubulata_027480 [Turnera subulata]
MMEETRLITEVTEKLQNMADASLQNVIWNKRSIYKIPPSVRALKTIAYRPQVVSFGPYYHNEDHLKPMEEHKQRALRYFLKRANKPIELLVQSLGEVAQDLKDCYSTLDQSWQDDTSRFLQLMVLDGCFLLEILQVAANKFDGYAADDPVFSRHGDLYIVPFIRRDVLMLENQLPMLVLHKLVAVASFGAKDEESINKLILNFCSPNVSVSNLGKCLHVLDLYRKSLLQEEPSKIKHHHHYVIHRGHHKDSNDIIRSATELNEAGIWFKKSKTKSLKGISFHRGVLKLPVVIVDDATEVILLNLMAFERLHAGTGNDITSFVFFMDNIIDDAMDVAFLEARGIIQNALGSDKAVAKLFNSLSKDIPLDPDNRLDLVYKQVNAYSRKRWNAWRANLIQTYFRNPWAVLSLIAAIILFALTIAQTLYSILQYHFPR